MARPRKNDGGLYKREDSKTWWMWYCWDRDGQRQRESTLAEDWQEAQQCLMNRLQARDENTLPAIRRGQQLTFGGMGGSLPGAFFQAALSRAEDP